VLLDRSFPKCFTIGDLFNDSMARFETIADRNSIEFARRLYGLAVSAFMPRGRLHLHPIEFNR